MNCYGHYQIANPACKQCKLKRYCQTSADPDLLADRACGIPVDALGGSPHSKPARQVKLYSRADLLEVIGFMAQLDYHTVELLAEKLRDPDITLEALGDRRKITRQAIHKFIKQRCANYPELSAVLQNRQHRIKTETSITFMEAVCQIKRSTPKPKSKEPAPPSTPSNSLINLSRSLDLSRMSIGKDASRCSTN